MQAELEAAIFADPDAREGYAVYADWLQSQDDPRGELIAVQLAREDRPTDEDLIAREAELFVTYRDEWLGSLGGTWPYRELTFTWRRGFIHKAVVPTSYQSIDAAVACNELFPLPAARFLRELEVGVAVSYGAGEEDTSVLEALRDHPPRVLRKLVLTAFDHQLSWSGVGDVSIANPALQSVEELEIVSGLMALGRIDAPRLRSLRLETGGLRSHVLASIASAKWPELETLIIYLGTQDYGGSCTVKDTWPILEGKNLGGVTTLALCNGTFGDELAARVIHAKILPQLEHLDLSKGTMGTDGARLLISARKRLAHLESIDLSQNYIPAAICEQLSHALPQANVERQRTDERYGRFVTVSE